MQFYGRTLNSMPMEIGLLLDSRYRIVKNVAKGGTADVFLAEDIINKREVIIKLLREDLAKTSHTLNDFKSEAAILACLNNANIVQVLGDGVFEEKPYIIFEYIKGNTLKDILDDRGFLTEKEALDYTLQLLNALRSAHAMGIVHRDIKPLNIFVLNDGTLKLADFGIAQVEGIKTMNMANYIVGSVHYIAPEIVLGDPVTPASDIYSCGILLFEMITGQVPFSKYTAQDTALAQVKDPFPSVRKLVSSCSKELENILNKCARKNPKERCTLDEFYSSISRLIHSDKNKNRKHSIFAKLFGAKK